MSRGSIIVSPTQSESTRFSSLGAPLSSSALSGSYPTQAILPKRNSIHTIYDRPLTRTKGTEVSLAAFAFLFSEITRYTQDRVDGISDFEKKLNILGYHVGTRLLSLTLIRDTLAATSTASTFRSASTTGVPQRMIKLLPALSWIHTTLWRTVVGKVADALERSNENADEYMISDNDLSLTRSITVPKEMSQLSCGALMAGIVEACLDGLGFPARVTSHSVPSDDHPRRTTVLIKLEPTALTHKD